MPNNNKTNTKLRLYPAEVFKEISLGEDDKKLQLFYAISNFGRLISFKDKIEDGRIVKGNRQDGYRIWRFRINLGNKKVKNKHRFLYKLVAEYFIPKTSDEQVYVLHLDRNRANDHVDNLQWATKAEMIEHSKKSPFVISARKKLLPLLWAKKGGSKLREPQVIILKKKLLDQNRKTKMKILAKQFGVSEMQLYRIKSGENWGDIKV
jgi:hypothetical protein